MRLHGSHWRKFAEQSQTTKNRDRRGRRSPLHSIPTQAKKDGKNTTRLANLQA